MTLDIRWIKDQLNDTTSDEELTNYFVVVGGITRQEAERWVVKRPFYANNIVVQDDEGNDVGIFNSRGSQIEPIN